MKKFIVFLLSVTFLISCKEEKPSTGTDVETNVSVDSVEVENSLTQIEQYIFSNPNSEKGYYELSNYYLNNNQPEDALKQINKALKIAPDDAEINYVKAETYVALNQIDKALPFLERTLELDSSHIGGSLDLAYYYLAGKNYEPSLKLINNTIKQNMYLARPYYLKGMWYEQQKKNELAISSYQTAIERDPNYYDAYLALGSIYNQMDNPLAIQYYNSALSIWPESIETWRLKGMSFYEHEDYEEAIICFDTILHFDSTFEVSYFDIGRTLINLCYDDNPEAKNDSLLNLAIHNFDKALSLNVNYVPAKFNRALCYETKGNYKLARAEYKAILELETNYEPAIKALNNLDRRGL